MLQNRCQPANAHCHAMSSRQGFAVSLVIRTQWISSSLHTFVLVDSAMSIVTNGLAASFSTKPSNKTSDVKPANASSSVLET